MNGKTPFLFNGKQVDSIKVIKNLSFKDNNLNFPEIEEGLLLKETSINLREAIKRTVEKIDMVKIEKIIDDIPEEQYGIKIISPTMKSFYKDFLKKRYEKIMLPALKKVKELEIFFQERKSY